MQEQAIRKAIDILENAPAFDYESQRWHDGGTRRAVALHTEQAQSTLDALASVPGYARKVGMIDPQLQRDVCAAVVTLGGV